MAARSSRLLQLYLSIGCPSAAAAFVGASSVPLKKKQQSFPVVFSEEDVRPRLEKHCCLLV